MIDRLQLAAPPLPQPSKDAAPKRKSLLIPFGRSPVTKYSFNCFPIIRMQCNSLKMLINVTADVPEPKERPNRICLQYLCLSVPVDLGSFTLNRNLNRPDQRATYSLQITENLHYFFKALMTFFLD